MKLESVSKEFAIDLITLVNQFKGISMDGAVKYKAVNFKYVTLDKILSIAKDNPNFALLTPLGTDDAGSSAVQVVLVHRTGDVLCSDYYKLRVPEGGSKQDEGSAITYTKRYAIGSFLGLCTDEDNDANPSGEGMPLGHKQSYSFDTQAITEKATEYVLQIAKKAIKDAGMSEETAVEWMQKNLDKNIQSLSDCTDLQCKTLLKKIDEQKKAKEKS